MKNRCAAHVVLRHHLHCSRMGELVVWVYPNKALEQGHQPLNIAQAAAHPPERGSWPGGAVSGSSWMVTVWLSMKVLRPYCRGGARGGAAGLGAAALC